MCVCCLYVVHEFMATIIYYSNHTVPSQVVVARTLTKKNAMMSVTTKVAMQLNCKLGGELWALEIPVSCHP